MLFLPLIRSVPTAATGGGPTDLTGTVQSLPPTLGWIGDWRVAGVTVHTSKTTVLHFDEARIRVGDQVVGQGTGQADGSLNALDIAVVEDIYRTS